MSNAAVDFEVRYLTAPVELRAEQETRTVKGYAAVFNSPADIGGAWIETVAPGTFAAAIGGDVRALFDHDSSKVLGRNRAGTLRLAEDTRGLAVEIDLPDTQVGRDLATSIERGDIDGMSFGFIVTKQTWDETKTPPTRTIEGVSLREVSIVTFPAYPDTTIGLRSLNAGAEQVDEHRRNALAAQKRIAERKARQEMALRRVASN